MTLGELNSIMARAQAQGYHFFLSYFPPIGPRCVRIALEKGSTYAGACIKVEGYGSTPSEAFENAIANFPPNPARGEWDSQHRLTAPESEPITDAEFTDINEGEPKHV